MKRMIIYLSIFLMLILLIFSFKFGTSDKFPAVVTCSLLLIIFISYFYFEKSSMGTKEIALLATLSAFAAVSRVPFVMIPNVQPVTFLVALSGYVFGAYEGFLVGSSSAFISNVFLGQGPWTPWQMFAWGLIGFISGLIGRKKNMRVELFSIICFLYGFLFDWIMNLWHVIGFIKPITVKTVLLAYLSGLTFDIMHAAGNFIFSMVFYTSFLKVLLRFRKRLEITYLQVNSKDNY